MPSISTALKIVLGIIAAAAGILAGIIGNDLVKNITYRITGPRSGRPPNPKPRRVWIVFYTSALIFVILSTIVAVAPTAGESPATPTTTAIAVISAQTATYEAAQAISQAETATQIALADAYQATAEAATATAMWMDQDDDRDGLTNGHELELDTLTNNRDTDGDDLSDGDEVNQWNTDPLDGDSDDDGLKDGDEVSRGMNPLDQDTDEDGTPDASDPDPGRAPTHTPTSTPTYTPTPTPTSTDTPMPTPTLGIGSTMVRERDGTVMVYVPSGAFRMGSTQGGSEEQPVHDVALDSFWIDKYEVTNAQYRNCVEAGVCQAPATCDWGGKLPYEVASKANHPVVCVDWYDAKTYCHWVGGRLPMEAEWEYATRGPDGYAYPWGNEFDCSRGNFDDETQINGYVVPGGAGCDGYDETAPVGSYLAGVSWSKALDMAGNVWEWTSSLFQDYPYRANDGREDPSSLGARVLRGGAWNDPANLVRSTCRDRWSPDGRNPNYGFRCVVPTVPSP